MLIFLILLILLLFSAFFSGSETALFGLTKIRVKRLQLENVKNSKTIAGLLDKPRRLIISILIGNMSVNILASSTASSLSLTLFGKEGLAVSIIAMTFLILVFGEIMPKVIAIRNPEKIAVFVAPYISVFSMAVFPFRRMLRSIVDYLTPLMSRGIKSSRSQLTEEELKKAVDLGSREGVLDKEEAEMIKSVFKFGDKTVKDVLIPLGRIVTVDISTPLSTIRSIIEKKELSRMPIFENRLDNILGILYAKDLVVAGQRGELSLRDILRKPFYVQDEMKLDELLRNFRTHRIHMALARNAKGKFVGMVTLQDLLEEIMGQIRDIKESQAA